MTFGLSSRFSTIFLRRFSRPVQPRAAASLSTPLPFVSLNSFVVYKSFTPARMDTTPALIEATVPASNSLSHHEKRKLPKRGGGPHKKQRFLRKMKPVAEGSTESILEIDIANLMAKQDTPGSEEGTPELPELFSTLDLEVSKLSSVGDGLAVHNGRVYVVPFSLPGDCISTKVVRHMQTHTVTDFLSVVRPSPSRDDTLVGCRYFGSCSGCQLQMLSYPMQLEHKKRVIENAYVNFSDLPDGILPPIGETIGSPLQYGYRTKLTPHFDGPRKGFKAAGVRDPPEIGFNVKGQRRVLDIEDCPIGVDSLREGIKTQRKYVHENIATFKRGATLLLRESTNRIQDGEDSAQFREEKLCITDSNATSTEYIDSYKFTSPAGAFFQNNNSILPTFTAYIRNNLSLPASGGTTSTEPPKYLVDAYCGSGLFTVTCGSSVQRAIGVDISADSIVYASKNAIANNITNASFIAGNAEKIFADINFPGVQTSCIIDPPRKGCDQLFLDQLLDFKPKRIVYVSCNVHTQARDLDYILKQDKGKGYKVDSIRGFDFFPQTHHVESVAVLTWVEPEHPLISGEEAEGKEPVR